MHSDSDSYKERVLGGSGCQIQRCISWPSYEHGVRIDHVLVFFVIAIDALNRLRSPHLGGKFSAFFVWNEKCGLIPGVNNPIPGALGDNGIVGKGPRIEHGRMGFYLPPQISILPVFLLVINALHQSAAGGDTCRHQTKSKSRQPEMKPFEPRLINQDPGCLNMAGGFGECPLHVFG